MVIKVKNILEELENEEKMEASTLEKKIDKKLKKERESLAEGEEVRFDVGEMSSKNQRISEYLRDLYKKSNPEMEIVSIPTKPEYISENVYLCFKLKSKHLPKW